MSYLLRSDLIVHIAVVPAWALALNEVNVTCCLIGVVFASHGKFGHMVMIRHAYRDLATRKNKIPQERAARQCKQAVGHPAAQKNSISTEWMVMSGVKLPSLRPLFCPFIRASVHPSMHWSLHPYMRPSVCLSIHMSVHPYVCLSAHPLVHACVPPCVRPLSACLSFCLSGDEHKPPRPCTLSIPHQRGDEHEPLRLSVPAALLCLCHTNDPSRTAAIQDTERGIPS